MKLFIVMIMSLLFTSAGFAADKAEKNEKKPEKSRQPAATSYFGGTMIVEHDTHATWGDFYRYYDHEHKVVCYGFEGKNDLNCVPSSTK